MKGFTEEELRSTILIPFLNDIGLSYSDLKLETSFTIQLGRGVYNVKNEKRKFIGGRLDILCKVDDKNLFIVELKAEDVPIDKIKDSQQGLSYARLMQPMPPYVIVTNGRETYLFDVIYGKEVDKSFIIENGYHVSIEDDILFRYNAMKNFIGYSYKNLLTFCDIVSNEHIRKFSSKDSNEVQDQLTKKHIPSLYVERNGMMEDFNSFLHQNEKNVYAMIGASGCGKTNSMLHIASELNDNPVVFYSGTLLGNSFFDELKFDFNLEFSPQETELTILKKISSLAELHNKQFIFFIDAIDEWIANDKSNQLDRIVKIMSRLNIKLCISCKDLLWSSLLDNRGIPTNLSEKLYSTFLIDDFSEAEFNEALVNYSSSLGVPIPSSKFSTDMYNPFSLRIAFEVSHSNKKVSLNETSWNSISLYLNQKITKSSEADLCKRYLHSIANLLLKNNTIHEKESEVRTFLNLGINDKIPEDLFLNSLLYRNNIENHNYIGFYFSKIRDFIISNEILSLNSLTQESRSKVISDSLDSFIGENAINFYLGNCNSDSLKDVMNALIEYDIEKDALLTMKLIAQQNLNFFERLNDEQIELLFTRINELIKSKSLNYINYEEINTVLNKLSKYSSIESQLIDLLILVNDSSINYNVYHICKLLNEYDSEGGTSRLVELVQNNSIETEIRRFALNSLNERNIHERKQVFLSLLNEYINTGGGPLFYATYWYGYVEDEELRGVVLDSFDQKPSESLVRILNHSKIGDTGELLFDRFLNTIYSENTTCWLCRTICTLNYRTAIPKFIQIIKDQRDSTLAGHLLIGLGETKAQELKPTLYDIIETLPNNYRNETWLSHAFSDIMDESDYLNLLELGKKSQNTPTVVFVAITLSSRKSVVFNEFILNCAMDSGIPENTRYKIFQEWSTYLGFSERKSGIQRIRDKNALDDVLSEHEILKVYSIFKEKTEMSVVALAVLLNYENNIDRLEEGITTTLPLLKYPFVTNRIMLINRTVLKRLKVRLKAWLIKSLQLTNWQNEYFLFNCLQFAGILGDYSHMETIENNKMNIYNCTAITLDNHKIDKRRYLEQILHTIRIADNDIRTRLG